MLKVILVRHGETDWNKSRRVQGGNSDPSLNETGREQAEALAQWLKREKIQAVYSSPLQRALDTARMIACHHKLETQLEPLFREIDVGELEGTELGMLGERLEELAAKRSQDAIPLGVGPGWWSKLEHIGGESIEGLQQRVWGALQRIIGQHSDGTIVVVSHYFVILTIICAVLGLPLSQFGRLRLGVGGISTVVFDGPAARLTLFNDSCHLNGVVP